MKIRFIKMLSILCAVMLMISAVFAWAAAEEDPATPTDLNPIEEEDVQEETDAQEEEDVHEEEESDDGPLDSIEILITKNLTLGQPWEGTVGKTKPAVLKLDLERAGSVYMLLEGKDAWATVEKADRVTGNAPHNQVNPETEELIYSWEAEAGSYIITVGPIEPNLLAMVKVTFMTAGAYEAWEETRDTEEDKEPEETEEEPETQPEENQEPAEEKQQEEENNPEEENELQDEEGPKSEEVNNPEEEEQTQNMPVENEEQHEDKQDENATEAVLNPDRSIKITVFYDTPKPVLGDIAHFRTEMRGYEEVAYSVQWQYSEDHEVWNDIPEANNPSMDVQITVENNYYYWRIVVFVEEESLEE